MPRKKRDQDVEVAGNLTKTVFMQHLNNVKRTQRLWDEAHQEAKEAKGVHAAALKAAKNAGINQAMLKQAIDIHTKRDEGDVARDFRDLGQMLRWMGSPIGTQFSLFDGNLAAASEDDDEPDVSPEAAAIDEALGGVETITEEDATFRAEDEGYKVGKGGRSSNENPNAPGTQMHQAWHSGWLRGNRALNARTEAAEGGNPLAH